MLFCHFFKINLSHHPRIPVLPASFIQEEGNSRLDFSLNLTTPGGTGLESIGAPAAARAHLTHFSMPAAFTQSGLGKLPVLCLTVGTPLVDRNARPPRITQIRMNETLVT